MYSPKVLEGRGREGALQVKHGENCWVSSTHHAILSVDQAWVNSTSLHIWWNCHPSDQPSVKEPLQLWSLWQEGQVILSRVPERKKGKNYALIWKEKCGNSVKNYSNFAPSIPILADITHTSCCVWVQGGVQVQVTSFNCGVTLL